MTPVGVAVVTAEVPRKRVAVDPHGLVAAYGDQRSLDLRILIEVRSISPIAMWAARSSGKP